MSQLFIFQAKLPHEGRTELCLCWQQIYNLYGTTAGFTCLSSFSGITVRQLLLHVLHAAPLWDPRGERGTRGEVWTWTLARLHQARLPATQGGAGLQGQLTTWQSEYSILGGQLPAAYCGAGLQASSPPGKVSTVYWWNSCQLLRVEQGYRASSPPGKVSTDYIGITAAQRWAPDIFFMVWYRWFNNFFPVIRLRQIGVFGNLQVC